MSARAASVLDRILAETRVEVERRKRERPLEAPDPSSENQPHRFRAAISGPEIAVIAEFKRRSPSAGSLRDAPDLDGILAAYTRGGAAALSILTEGPNFGGALADLEVARSTAPLALLRKDFMLDRYQLYEARRAGADAVLLIVAALDDRELAALYGEAQALGLDVLVEVHDAEELSRALELGAEMIGVNNRDLRDFSVEVERTERLMEQIPAGTIVVSESGISAAEQLTRLQRRGVAAVLVGETLMRAADPAAALRELRGL